MKGLATGALIILVSLLCGCQTTVPAQQQVKVIQPEPVNLKDFSDAYLRGTFNWWNAEEPYRLQQVGDKALYRVKVTLVADGQYYSFLFADAEYNPGKNCGYLKPLQAVVKADGPAVKSNCTSLNSYFKFKPNQTGSYYFYLDHTAQEPKVYIRRAY